MRRPTAALAASVALHGGLAALLLIARYDAGSPSTGNVMFAELVRLPDAPAETHDAEPTPRADEPPPLPSSPPASEEIPAPPIDPAPEPRPPAVAERLAPPAPPAPEPEAEPAPREPPIAQPLPERTVIAPVTPEPAEQVAAAADPAAATDPAEPAAEPAPQPIPMPEPQEQMLAQRYDDWTGSSVEMSEASVWKHAGREYTAVFRPLPAEDSMGIDRLVVEITTEQDGRRVATELTMRRLAFSSFAQFVDRWDPEVQIHDDEIDGRFHSNTEINVLRNGRVGPVFRGRVTTASRSIRSDSIGRFDRRDTFLAGLETGVRKISMPRMPFADRPPPAEDMHEFGVDTRITFHADGSYTHAPLDPPAAETVAAIGAAPRYLVAAGEAQLYVRGVVKGRVLVYAPYGIVIEDDLTYAAHPGSDPTSGDYLGLVSDRSIAVAEPNVTGPGDLTIHASIFAKRQFAVRNFRSRRSGTLYVYGSVSAGSITATEPRYATKIEYDPRLAQLRAPGFPFTDRYELESWDAVWRPTD